MSTYRVSVEIESNGWDEEDEKVFEVQGATEDAAGLAAFNQARDMGLRPLSFTVENQV